MKNLAEQITALKNAEKVAWERYCSAVEKEANALLKRYGSVITSEKARLVGVQFHELNSARYNEDKDESKKSLRHYSDYALVMEVVNRIEYVDNLRDKWFKVSAKLTEVINAIDK